MKKTFLLLIAVAFFFLVSGQQSSQPQISFNHLALSVKNVDSSAEFYKRIFNLKEISKEERATGVRWLSLGNGQELHLISDIYYKRGTVITNKAIHLALTTNNFDELIKILNSINIAYSNWAGVSQKINIREDGIKQIFCKTRMGIG